MSIVWYIVVGMTKYNISPADASVTAVTTIQVPIQVRDAIKTAAGKRAHKMGISKLSMADYLKLVADNE